MIGSNMIKEYLLPRSMRSFSQDYKRILVLNATGILAAMATQNCYWSILPLLLWKQINKKESDFLILSDCSFLPAKYTSCNAKNRKAITFLFSSEIRNISRQLMRSDSLSHYVYIELSIFHSEKQKSGCEIKQNNKLFFKKMS